MEVVKEETKEEIASESPKRDWKPEDIITGIYIIRESSPKASTDIGFRGSVTFKVGWHLIGDPKKQYCLVSIADGMILNVDRSYPATKEELCYYLNSDEHGYRQATLEEIIGVETCLVKNYSK